MHGRLASVLGRQLDNYRYLRAFSLGAFVKSAIAYPFDRLSADGSASLPLNLAIFVTLRCNLRCEMCNVVDLLTDERRDEPSVERLSALFAELDRGTSVTLFGGEPLLRKDLTEIVAAAKRRGLSVNLFTNGMALDARAAKSLLDAGLDAVAFSLLGGKKAHERATGHPRAYELIVRHMREFSEVRGAARAVVHCTISPENLGELETVAETGFGCGVDHVRFGHPTYFDSHDVVAARRYFAERFPGEPIGPLTFGYRPAFDAESVVRAVTRARDAYGKRVSFTPALTTAEIRDWYGGRFRTERSCMFVYRGGFVRPNGDMTPCESLDYVVGNVYERGFRAVWNGERQRRLRLELRRGLTPACARCCKL